MVNKVYTTKTKEELINQNLELKAQLDEAEQTLSAIQNGEIDAIITPQGSDGPKVYTLESADTLYRNLI
jgi:two-component system, OmpR family, phosphate regulon sensor histidine kinase PhoR